MIVGSMCNECGYIHPPAKGGCPIKKINSEHVEDRISASIDFIKSKLIQLPPDIADKKISKILEILK